MKFLLVFLLMVSPILLLFGILHYLSYKNWTSVYTAFDDKTYFKVIGKLKGAGVPFRTKSHFNQTVTMFGGNRQRQYDIYVRKEDEHKAKQCLF